jgi:hypothetical protein
MPNATSGQTNSWQLTSTTIITAALRKLGVIPSGGTATTNQYNDALDNLNAIIKAYQADGMPLWKISSQTFTVASGTNTYTVGPSQTINCPKPLKILQATWTPVGGTNIPMNIYTRYDYEKLPQGSNYTSDPVDLYYQPGNTTGTIFLWPTPSNSTTQITFQFQAPYEDQIGTTNGLDFPSEWMMPLIYKLSWVMAPEYGIPPTDRDMLGKEAEYWHQYVLGMGGEEGDITIQPMWDR